MANRRNSDLEGSARPVVPLDDTPTVQSAPETALPLDAPSSDAVSPVQSGPSDSRAERPDFAARGQKQKGIPSGGWDAVQRCSYCGAVKHWPATGAYIFKSEPGAIIEVCDQCGDQGTPKAEATKTRPAKRAVKGISAETDEQRAAREAMERTRAEEAARLERERLERESRDRKQRFSDGATFCEAMIGAPLVMGLGAWLQKREQVDITTVKTRAVQTAGPGAPAPVQVVETTVDKALAHGVGEIVALYAPDVFNHPALPALATACLAFQAVTMAVRDERLRKYNLASVRVEVMNNEPSQNAPS